jgi:hypothetical protein
VLKFLPSSSYLRPTDVAWLAHLSGCALDPVFRPFAVGCAIVGCSSGFGLSFVSSLCPVVPWPRFLVCLGLLLGLLPSGVGVIQGLR